MSDLAKYSVTVSTAQALCNSWASCCQRDKTRSWLL